MALNWNVRDVLNHKDVCLDDEGKPKPLTEALIFGLVSVGIGKITRKNWTEVYARLVFIEKYDGVFLHTSSGKERPITPVDVMAHIGLSTNVSNESRAKWLGRLKRDLDVSVREAERTGFLD